MIVTTDSLCKKESLTEIIEINISFLIFLNAGALEQNYVLVFLPNFCVDLKYSYRHNTLNMVNIIVWLIRSYLKKSFGPLHFMC